MTTSEPNAGQIEYWNGEVGRRWVDLQDRLDTLFSGLTEMLLEHAAPALGERAVDVGCGCGATVLALARRVGENGHVLGVDISEVMLDVARRRIEAGGYANAEVLLADAAVQRFEPGSADLLLSRFGVMFFDRPREAFANLRNALRPGARLVFVCWRPFAENPWFSTPYWAAKPHVPLPDEPKPDPGAPGPFSLDDPARVEAILAGAGFSHIGIVPRDLLLHVASSGAVGEAARFLTQIGPVSRLLAGAAREQREASESAIRAALAAFDGSDGIRMPARVWLVSAKT